MAFQCPYCSHEGPPNVRKEGLSSTGLVVFILLLVFCLPLCWDPLRRQRVQGRGARLRCLWNETRINRGLRCVALAAFLGYVAWNMAWLLQALPDSIWRCATGLPCPTTGVTRSLHALGCGHLREFFLFNPMTAGYALLLVVSGIILCRQWLSARSLALPRTVAVAWFVALTAGWVLKFATPPAYW